MVDGHLVGRQFVASDRYTIADIMALVTVNFAARINLTVPEACSHLRRWHEKCQVCPLPQPLSNGGSGAIRAAPAPKPEVPLRVRYRPWTVGIKC
jgi:glutathione S-transferase